MTAIVSSIAVLLRAEHGASASQLSNGCATPRPRRARTAFVVAALVLAAVFATAELARAQPAAQQPATPGEHHAATAAKFLAGGALGLVAHESGHLLFDGIFDAHPGVKKVSFHGLPFFAITHEGGVSPTREFAIDSAGFWVQNAGNEILLSRRPNLRYERAPVLKGVFAFNVLASVAYAGAAFAQTGPGERDTLGMAQTLRWKEPEVGALILAPAVLDAIRFFHPDAAWAVWASRAAKVGMVLLVFRPGA